MTLVVLFATVAAAGCGTGADQDRVRATTARFFSALDARRGGESCKQLSSALAKAIEQEHRGEPCASVVASIEPRGSAVTRVRVYATSARADLAGGESVFLGLTRGGWRIEALGCRVRASGPYECEEQG
jgi:hypothetical protein